MRRVRAVPTEQPRLPSKMPGGGTWPARTRAWWRQWARSPLAAGLTALEWEELLIAAVLHARFWSGDVKVAGELRLRVLAFGVTPESRARLRIEFAPPGDEAPPASKRELRLVEGS